MKPQHTPFTFSESNADDYTEGRIIIFNSEYEEIAITNNEDHAAFIIRACNNHEALVEALEHAIRQIKSSSEFNAPIKKSFSVQNLVENTLRKALSNATKP